MPRIGREEGRRLFGLDPAAYDAARPGHAERVYDVLVKRCGLGPDTSVLEIGPGTGQATRRVLRLGATPLLAVEPDPALAAYLGESLADRVDVRIATLEDAQLPTDTFALAIAASSFHWVDEEIGLAKVLAALKPGGWFAMWWTLFGEPGRPDAFITATSPLLAGLDASPTAGEAGRPAHALDSEARLAALERAGFGTVEHEVVAWQASWDTEGIRALYATFSPISRLEDERKTEILDAIARIAELDFGGRIERTLLTSLYTARRPY
ncbi:class I SAM-dependent methyltransferase [soil metagenome]